jgi:hypothetical protein
LLFPAGSAVLVTLAFQVVYGYPLAQVLMILLGVHNAAFTYAVFFQPSPPQIEPEPEPEPPPVGFTTIRSIPELDTDRVYPSLAVNVEARDPRIKQWAWAVAYSNSPMTQAKWAGGKRPFSKPEYEAWMKSLLERGVVVPKYAKGNQGGFRPNGAAGWQFIKGLADGREYIPLPQVDRSKSEYLWVRA